MSIGILTSTRVLGASISRWFSPGTPDSSTTKTGRHDIAEILLKVALNTKNQSINQGENHREIDAPNTRVHSHSLSAIDTDYTDTSIKSGGVKQDNTCFRCDQPNV
jgi:hypothetical protein